MSEKQLGNDVRPRCALATTRANGGSRETHHEHEPRQAQPSGCANPEQPLSSAEERSESERLEK
jgi:hypothetical protein